jgi:predicted lipoprotein with Yx(FWY)xxD motif
MATSGSRRTVPWRGLPVLLVSCALAVLTVADSSGSGASSVSINQAVGSARTTSTTGSGGQLAAAGTSPFYDVKTRQVSGLGTVLVNGQGLTLYMFVPDKQRGRSTCYRTCASGWPPLRLPAGVTVPVASGRAKPSLLGITTRKDGSLQVTYNRWPLYLWVSDTRPGQATGEGINSLGGYWYALTPKGQIIKKKH